MRPALTTIAWPRRLVSTMLASVVASVSAVALTSGPAGTIVEPWIDTSNRDAVAVAWEQEQSRAVPSMDWTGSLATCDAGGASTELAQATVARVNFYRGMAGVPASVRLNEDYSALAQHTALTMSATGRLSHAPDDSFECLDEEAREGAANSNLYLGRIGPSAIDGYIEDPGERNRDVGHRNTILHPPTVEMGVGHVQGSEANYPANALWVFDERVFDDNPALREAGGFVAWPPRGYVPDELAHPRWSFGLAGADFENASVTMAVAGRPVELEVVTRHSLAGYVPAPIIVWEPDPAVWPRLVGDEPVEPADPTPTSTPTSTLTSNTAGQVDGAAPEAPALPAPEGQTPGDLAIDVTVTGVLVDGQTVDFAYRVVLFDPDTDPGPGDPLDLAFQVARILAVPVPDLG